MTTPSGAPGARGVRESLRAADAVLAAPGEVWRLGTADAAGALVDLARLKSRVAALEAELLVQAEKVGVDREARCPSLGVWLAHATGATRRASFRAVRTAQALEECPEVARELAAGGLTPEQAEVIAVAVTDIPAGDIVAVPRIGPLTEAEAAAGVPVTVEVSVRGLASQNLLEQAKAYDAKGLRVLASRFWEVIDPGTADARECAALEEQEKRAAKRLRFSLVDHGDGTVEGWFRIPTRHGAALRKMLMAIAAPKAQRAANGAGGYDPAIRTPAKWGQSFCDLIDRITDSDPPTGAGSAPPSWSR